ncbi:hypothetical protein DVH24_037942 [Malus domestica]|uniref:Uncharacterized protein n=1 Tax=Malus domestica TaxID=3750 RepID=A0A498K266_MALDO|nr:hypothetical protein DVH24_037942 [Malus domestica]
MDVVEMRMLRWMCGHMRKNKIRNEDIQGNVGVAEIEGKMRENRLRWFGRVQRRPTNAPVKRCNYGTEVQGRRGRGRPRKTLSFQSHLLFPKILYASLNELSANNALRRIELYDCLRRYSAKRKLELLSGYLDFRSRIQQLTMLLS